MYKNIKVIELSSVLAGPSVGTFLAELGAEVIKIEDPRKGGDVTRSWKLPKEHRESNTSAYFASANYGKTYLLKDLNNETDKEFVYELIRDCDIVIGNFKPGSAKKLGFDDAMLRALKEDIIYVNLIGFENTDKPAYDIVLQAETGWLSMTGSKDDPAKMPVALIDVIAAHHMKEATLLALLKRERTGKGSFVEVSLEKASLASLVNQASNYLNEGHLAKPIGTLHPNIAPYGEMLISSDNVQFVLAIGSDKQFFDLCEILDLAEIAHDKDYATNSSRVINRGKLLKLILPKAAQIPFEKFEKDCMNQKIPIGKLKKLDEVLGSKAALEMILKDENGLLSLSHLAFDKKDLIF